MFGSWQKSKQHIPQMVVVFGDLPSFKNPKTRPSTVPHLCNQQKSPHGKIPSLDKAHNCWTNQLPRSRWVVPADAAQTTPGLVVTTTPGRSKMYTTRRLWAV